MFGCELRSKVSINQVIKPIMASHRSELTKYPRNTFGVNFKGAKGFSLEYQLDGFVQIPRIDLALTITSSDGRQLRSSRILGHVNIQKFSNNFTSQPYSLTKIQLKIPKILWFFHFFQQKDFPSRKANSNRKRSIVAFTEYSCESTTTMSRMLCGECTIKGGWRQGSRRERAFDGSNT